VPTYITVSQMTRVHGNRDSLWKWKLNGNPVTAGQNDIKPFPIIP